ncbi:myrosinase 1-like, partial [Aphis craccivora]
MTDEEFAAEPNLKRRDRGYFMDLHNTTEAEVFEGFLNCLKWIKEKMNNPKIFIGENGFPEEDGIDESEKKIAYHTGILNKLLEALDENINVFGYCVWSFLDTLEFNFGYWKRFGIYAVDFNDESRPPESFVSTKQFPENFLLGTTTGAFQVERAFNEDLPESVIKKHIQKGVKPRLSDLYKGMGVYEFPSSAINDGTHFYFNGDIAADTYHKTDIDVKLLKELGVQVYRFSIAPTRIIPRVHDNTPGKEGIAYYNKLIDKLIENGITPMASLYHFDVGECFNKIGGLSNPVSYKFYPNFSRICFENFGDRVKHWSTTADIHLATEGYSSEHFAPGYQESIFSGFLEYEAIHNSMITQSLMWKVYNEEFKEKQKGEVSLTIDGVWYYPKDPNNPEHQKCAESARMSTFGLIAHILSTGQYPDEFLEAIDKSNKREKIRVDRARQFTQKEQELI